MTRTQTPKPTSCNTVSRRASVVVGLLALTLAGPAYAGDEDDQGCSDEASLCVEAGEAEWTADEQLSGKAMRRDAKRNRKRKPVAVSVSIEGGRGSVFVDGRWAGEAPLGEYELQPGRHDLQVRDGETVLSEGILKISRKSDAIEITVRHPDA